jgi:hypothetical protein
VIGEVVGVSRDLISGSIKKWKLRGLKALKPVCSRRLEGTSWKRADCENVFAELKNQWGFNGF